MKTSFIAAVAAIFFGLITGPGVVAADPPAEPAPPLQAKQLPPETLQQLNQLIQQGDYKQIVKMWDEQGGPGPEFAEINETFRRALLALKFDQLPAAFAQAWACKKRYVYLDAYNVLETLKDKRTMTFLLGQVDVRPDTTPAKACGGLISIAAADRSKVAFVEEELRRFGPAARPVMRMVLKEGAVRAPWVVDLAKRVLDNSRIPYLDEKIERLNRFDSPDLVPYYRALIDGERTEMKPSTVHAVFSILVKYGDEKDAEIATGLLADKDKNVRNEAAWCVGCLKYKPAADALGKLLDDDACAESAAVALGKIGEKKYLQKISELARGITSIAATKPFVLAMAMLGDRSTMNKWLESGGFSRELGAEIFSEVATENDAPALLKLVEGKPDAFIVYFVARAFEKSGSKDEKARAALKAAYAAADRTACPPDFDVTVKRTLILMGDGDVEKQLFDALKNEKDGKAKSQIIDEIGRIGIRSHIPLLAPYLEDATVVNEKRATPDVPLTVSDAASMAIIRISGVEYFRLWDHDPARRAAEIKAWWEGQQAPKGEAPASKP